MRYALASLAIVLGLTALGSRPAWAQQPAAPAAAPTPGADPAAPAAAADQAAPTPPVPVAEQPVTPPAAPAAEGAAAAAPAADVAAPAAPAADVAAPAAEGAAAPAAAGAPAVVAAPAKDKTWYELLGASPYEYKGTYWLPPSASSTTYGPDAMFYAVLGLSIFFFVAITGAVVYFCIKYRHRPGHKAEPSPAHNDVLEMTWTIIPTIMCVFLFVYGWRTYLDNNLVPETKPENQIYAIANKWNWSFRYHNGVEEPVLHAPLGEPVKLIITSTDVLHSLFVPAFRIKQDAVPRRYTYAWFYATRTGVFRLYCTEYCGTDHSLMKTNVVVHDASDYHRFLDEAYASKASLSGAPLGAQVWEKKGCASCHSVDGSAKIGPTWKGVFGQAATLQDGNKITVDEAYLKKAIVSPGAEGRPNFTIGTMPITPLSDKEIEGVIEYIKSLK